jgi:solute carrier family 25 (mitochondrial oxoglutarate transporter), member 11
LFAGAFGSFVGNPFDLALVRMQSDATLPLAERRNYRNVFDAFRRIVSEEGVTACWNGATPTILRAMSLNVAMLVSYDESKERLTAYLGKDASKTGIIFGASMVSAVATSTCSLPFDNMKTKLQKMKKRPDGTFQYKGIVDCAIKTVANEGITGFWAGLPTYYFRVGPHAIITLLTAEYLRTIMF